MLYSVLMALVLCVSVCGNVIVVVAVICSPLLKARQTFTFAASLGEFLVQFSITELLSSTLIIILWFIVVVYS